MVTPGPIRPLLGVCFLPIFGCRLVSTSSPPKSVSTSACLSLPFPLSNAVNLGLGGGLVNFWLLSLRKLVCDAFVDSFPAEALLRVGESPCSIIATTAANGCIEVGRMGVTWIMGSVGGLCSGAAPGRDCRDEEPNCGGLSGAGGSEIKGVTESGGIELGGLGGGGGMRDRRGFDSCGPSTCFGNPAVNDDEVMATGLAGGGTDGSDALPRRRPRTDRASSSFSSCT